MASTRWSRITWKARFIGVGILIVIAWGIWLAQDPGPINRHNFERIQENMTRTEVEAILGGPGEREAGDFHSFPVYWSGGGRRAIIVQFGWRSNGDINDPVVLYKLWFNPSLWDRIKEWWGGYELHPGGGKSRRVDPV